jgi:GNAT superfamily N-acetyltransferase
MEPQYWKKGDYLCTTDKGMLQVDVIHKFLSERSYWAKGRSKEKVVKSIAHSLCFGVFRNEEQVGFARVVTDYAIYAYLLDVFVIENERGHGLGKFLMDCIMGHPELADLKRWMLGTEDAHGLYTQYGFTALKKMENHMEKVAG